MSLGLQYKNQEHIFDEKTVNSLEGEFINDLKECTEITYEEYMKRGKMFKLRESVSRLISPML